MPDKVTVPEVAPVQVSKHKALRLFIGRFVVDFVETFAGIAGPTVLILAASPPGSIEAWKVALLQFGAPALSALISAGRRAWPAIKKWLTGE